MHAQQSPISTEHEPLAWPPAWVMATDRHKDTLPDRADLRRAIIEEARRRPEYWEALRELRGQG